MAVSSSKLARLGGGALFDAIRIGASRCNIGLALLFLDDDPPEVVFLNEYPAELLGYSHEEMTNVGLFRLATPEDVPTWQRQVARLREGESPPSHFETTLVSKSGTRIPAQLSLADIELDGVRAVVVFFSDITERKAIQARLAEAERLTALGMLSAGVAHEINNPLAYVLLNLEYVRQQLPQIGADPERLEGLLGHVRDACHGAQRVATIVRDLRTFARHDDGARATIDLCDVVEAAINIAGNTLKQAARIVRDYRDGTFVHASASRLEQVFLNLLLNAAQALPGRPERDEIRIYLAREGDRVVAEVTDTGPGIPPHAAARIFEPFFTTKPVGVGTSLGLPICRSIVTAHGGTIDLVPRPGPGATFRITLPAAADARLVTRFVSSHPPPTVGPRGRLLVVDDDVAVGNTLRLVLEREHDVRLVRSAEEALHVLAEDARFDAIVCDLVMPGMGGIDLYEALRRMRSPLAERMIFMTGGAVLPRTRERLARSKNPILEKPFDVAVVRRALERFVPVLEAAPSTSE